MIKYVEIIVLEVLQRKAEKWEGRERIKGFLGFGFLNMGGWEGIKKRVLTCSVEKLFGQ